MRNIEDTVADRPWGNYIKLYQEMGVWVKRVEVKPQQRLSLQFHNKRSEKWIVVKGAGVAIVNDEEIHLQPGSTVDIPLSAVHRMWNTGDKKLVFIEVATGDYLSEDDITRVQDDYVRKEDEGSNS